MDSAGVEQCRAARLDPEPAPDREFGVAIPAAVVPPPPFRHPGDTGGLAVDRPRGAVVVGFADPVPLNGAVGEDVNPAIRIVVQETFSRIDLGPK